MDRSFNSYIFQPSEKHESLDEQKNLISWIILLIAILCLVLDLIYPALIILFGIISSNIWLLATRTNEYPKLNGSFPIKLTITPNQIIIGDKKFNIQDIQIQRIICFDYKGRKELEYALFFKYMAKSNGVYNHIWFNHDKKVYKLRFRVDSVKHMEQLEAIKKEIGVK